MSPGPARARARASRWAVVMGLLVVGGLQAGCHARIPRLVAQGRHDEAIELAEAGRRRPRGKAARAWAAALVHAGRSDEAHAVLLKDFRRGGGVASLVALADLERAEGYDGLAAVHYARAFDLDARAVSGRTDVCTLLSRRAQVLLGLGDALAAEQDLRRAERACPGERGLGQEAEHARLARAIDENADAQVRARARVAQCKRPDCSEFDERRRIADIEQTLRVAHDGPLAALRETAALLNAQVPAQAVVRLLDAELRGRLGPWILSDDELRRLVGDQGWGAFAPIVAGLGEPEAAWVQLRLAPVVSDLPIPPSPRGGPAIDDKWVDQAQLAPDIQAWRIHLWRGDLPAAELALAARFRPVRTEAPAEPGPDAGPAHWGARVELDEESLPAMLLLARLRHAAGHEDLALELSRHVLGRARALDVPNTIRVAAEEAMHAIAFGEPWTALALLDGLSAAELVPIERTAASAILLSRAFCGGACRDDADAALVERVMGEAWVASTVARLPTLALEGNPSLDEADGCPPLSALLEADAEGDLPRALRRARQDVGAPEVGRMLVSAIAADLGLWCAGRVALPLLAEARAELRAGELAERLAHAPQDVSTTTLEVVAGLALVAGQRDRAELLSRAAAGASTDPSSTWARLARLAHATGDRERELEALRELVLHAPDLRHPAARQALVLAALRDVSRAAEKKSPLDREALSRAVGEYVRGHAPAQRWAVIEALVDVVVRASWATPEVREALLDALPTEDARLRHAPAVARLTGTVPERFGPQDATMLALAIAARRQSDIPVAMRVAGDAVTLEPARLAIARHVRDWSTRRRFAIAVAVQGSARSRAEAVAVLREMTSSAPDRRRAIDELIAQRPAALEPGLGSSDGFARASAVVDDPEVLLRLLFGLDLEPAWVAR